MTLIRVKRQVSTEIVAVKNLSSKQIKNAQTNQVRHLVSPDYDQVQNADGDLRRVKE